jgi:hypothetical protein
MRWNKIQKKKKKKKKKKRKEKECSIIDTSYFNTALWNNPRDGHEGVDDWETRLQPKERRRRRREGRKTYNTAISRRGNSESQIQGPAWGNNMKVNRVDRPFRLPIHLSSFSLSFFLIQPGYPTTTQQQQQHTKYPKKGKRITTKGQTPRTYHQLLQPLPRRQLSLTAQWTTTAFSFSTKYLATTADPQHHHHPLRINLETGQNALAKQFIHSIEPYRPSFIRHALPNNLLLNHPLTQVTNTKKYQVPCGVGYGDVGSREPRFEKADESSIPGPTSSSIPITRFVLFWSALASRFKGEKQGPVCSILTPLTVALYYVKATGAGHRHRHGNANTNAGKKEPKKNTS